MSFSDYGPWSYGLEDANGLKTSVEPLIIPYIPTTRYHLALDYLLYLVQYMMTSLFCNDNFIYNADCEKKNCKDVHYSYTYIEAYGALIIHS